MEDVPSDISQMAKHGQLPGSTSSIASLSSVHPIYNPAMQVSSSRLSQGDIDQIVATVGVYFQLSTWMSSRAYQVNPISSSAEVSTIAVRLSPLAICSGMPSVTMNWLEHVLEQEGHPGVVELHNLSGC